MSSGTWKNPQRGRHDRMISGGPDPAISGWRQYIHDPEINREPGPSGAIDRVLFSRPTGPSHGLRGAVPALWIVDYGSTTPAFFDGQGERDDYDYRRPPRTKAGIAAYIVKFLSEFASRDKVLSGEWFIASYIAREFRSAVIVRLRKKGFTTTIPNAPHLPAEIL